MTQFIHLSPDLYNPLSFDSPDTNFSPYCMLASRSYANKLTFVCAVIRGAKNDLISFGNHVLNCNMQVGERGKELTNKLFITLSITCYTRLQRRGKAQGRLRRVNLPQSPLVKGDLRLLRGFAPTYPHAL
jgi:hypothetical protein